MGRRVHAGVRALVLTAILAGTTASASAAGPDGSPDLSFGRAGIVTTPLGSLAVAAASAVQSDGAIVTAGQATIDNRAMVASTRYTPDGRLDSTYGDGGVVLVDINASSSANAIAVQPDGRIVLAGTGKDPVTGTLAFAAVRLMPDGSPDPSFGDHGIAIVPVGHMAIANGVALLQDGRIVLGGAALNGTAAGDALLATGAFALGGAGLGNTPVGSGIGQAQFGGRAVMAAVRLTANGAPDPSFGRGGVMTVDQRPGVAWGVAKTADGGMILAGETPEAGSDAFMGVKVSSAGAVDPTFAQQGFFVKQVGDRDFCDAVTVRPDGRVVLAGASFRQQLLAAVVQLLPDGAPDRGFGAGGVATTPTDGGVNAVALQADGKVLMGATGASALRLTAGGTPDPEFGDGGVVRAKYGSADAANGITTQPDGKVVLAGGATINGRIELSVVRLESRPPPAAGASSQRSRRRVRVRLEVRARTAGTKHPHRRTGRALVRQGARARATLTRGGHIVAKGTLGVRGVTLRASRPVRGGKYLLTLGYKGPGPQRVRQSVVVR